MQGTYFNYKYLEKEGGDNNFTMESYGHCYKKHTHKPRIAH